MSNPYLLSIATTAATLLAVLSLTLITTDGQAPVDNTAKVTPAVSGGAFPRQLTVYDRQGEVLRTLGEPGRYYSPVLSPDGTRLAALELGRTKTIWVFDLSTGTKTQVMSALFPDQGYTSGSPVWSPDGSQIAYWIWRRGYGGLYRKASNGTGVEPWWNSEELLYRHTLGVDIPLTDWSPDGRFLSFSAGDVLWVMPFNGNFEQKALELAREEFSFFGARFSPDSRFLAYTSDESGRNEVYVRPFDPASGFTPGGGKWQVSNQGGLGLVQWRRDGRELYYLAADGGVMAVDVTTTPAFEAGPPRLLFRAPATFPLTGTFDREGTNAPECGCSLEGCEQGSISRDGQRVAFAVPIPPERKEVTVAAKILPKYTGTFELPENGDRGGEIDVVVTLEGNQLMFQPNGREKVPLFAESETNFFLKATHGDLEFVSDDKGVVTHSVLYRGFAGQKVTRK